MDVVGTIFDTLTRAGVVAGAMTSIMAFGIVLVKTSTSLSDWFSAKFRKFMRNTVGHAVREQLEYRNGGDGFGDKMVQLAEGQTVLDGRLTTVEGKVADIDDKIDASLGVVDGD